MSTREMLSTDQMLAAAQAEARLDDFGDNDFVEPLRRLVDASNESPVPLSDIGTAAFKGEVQRMLVNRLRFARDLKAHPDIHAEDVDDPIVIIGMPRTGTTKLHRMLSADPDVQRLDYWRIFNPAPFDKDAWPPLAGGEDPRKGVARQAVAMMSQLMPDWLDSHPTDADDVDEEVFLQLYTFKCKLHYILRPVPRYQSWMQMQSLHDSYAYTKLLLKYLQWQDDGREGANGARPWILKSPVHLGNVDVLLDTFPRATLVCPHRDLREVMPSLCRLMENTRLLYTGQCDRIEVGRACLDIFGADMKRHMLLRSQIADRLNILDVRYEDIRDKPLSVAAMIYVHAGRELTPRRQHAMKQWVMAHPQRKSSGYSYRLEDYGYTPQMINAEFQDYIGRFPY